MCGLTGFWHPDGDSEQRMAVLARKMAETLIHRGPDDSGVWVNAQDGIAIGFRRLSVLDLTRSGHQPMVSINGRFVIAFNGEIYNHRELRAELEEHKIRFRGTSDTEVILEGFSFWGVKETIPKLWGMFAIVVWDHERKELILVRDRLGKKPLYYMATSHLVLFGSELKPLRQHPLFHRDINREALAAYLRFGYVPAPQSIYKNVFKLPPGTCAFIRKNSLPEILVYWDPLEVVESAMANRLTVSDDEAVTQLENLLRDAVARRMIADVPIGALLSGGIDSSLVVALMQAQSAVPIRTYTIGFHMSEYDEAPAAKAVAGHLGTEHSEIYVSPEDALAVIPKIPLLYDEPFADSSQIPTYLVCALARRHVTVSLSGDGGDELFAGYTRYALAARIWKFIRLLPGSLRGLVKRTIRALPPGAWNALSVMAARSLPRQWQFSLLGNKMYKLSELLVAEEPSELYAHLVSHWKDPGLLTFGAKESDSILGNPSLLEQVPTFTERMMLLDLISYLPDDILHKLDRASMGVSLEMRCPFLDHRLVEWIWRLPMNMKIRGGNSKWLLRRLLYKHVPPKLVERPKMGFAIPLGEWLRGPLREWAESLLSEAKLRQQGFFNPEPIRQAWTSHLTREQNEQYRLWTILMFQSWLQRWPD